MFVVALFWLAVAVLLLCAWAAFERWLPWQPLMKGARLPPGPRGSWLFGPLDMMPSIAEWSQAYGPLCCVVVGVQPVVIVNDINVAQLMFRDRGSIYSDRSQGYIATQVLTRGGRSITMSNYGEYWKTIHKLFVSILGEHEVKHYDSRFKEEALSVVQELSQGSRGGQVPVNPANVLVRFAVNTIIRSIFGVRVKSGDDPRIAQLRRVNDDVFTATTVGRARLLDFYPWRRWYPSGKKLIKDSEVLRDRREGIADIFLRDMEQEIADGSQVRCFARDCLAQMSSLGLERVDILNMCTAMMIAASDGPSIFMQWLIVLLANRPEVQARVHAELDQFVGSDRLPTREDERQLEYLKAVVRETMRFRPKAFTGIPHACAQDDVVPVGEQRYFIPKGSIVMINSKAIDFDPRRFTDPENFNPDRYLGLKESTARLAYTSQPYSKRDHFAFGVGKRVCPGIPFAESELYFATAYLLWSFRIERPSADLLDEVTIRQSHSFSPKEFSVRFVPRHPSFERVIQQA